MSRRAPQLDYAKRPPRRRRVLLFLVLLALAAAAVPLAINYTRALAYRFQVRRSYDRCAEYAVAPSTLVYDESPSQADSPIKVNRISRIPPLWTDFCHAAGAGQIRSNGTLFLGERKSPSGDRLLIGVDITGWSRGGPVILYCNARTFFPASVLELPHQTASLGTESINFGPTEGLLRLFAGQADPNDASHFTVAYTLSNQAGVIDGYLQNDGSVVLELRRTPATLP
ncbi:MAG: hypothetical protein ABIP55_10810 [Tepidisphaeraceae bacterium]